MRLARVRATAYPKLTLSLRVIGVRDDGYHELEALVVSLGQPHDVLEAYAVPRPAVCGSRSIRESPERAGIPTDHTNLAFVAAEKLLVRAGRSGHGVRIVLRKRIPAGAGLGGGSADAAAALLAVRRLLEVDIDDAGVLALAAEVGSDVPFCLRGGAAWMRGRGELLEPVDVPAGLAVPRRDPAVPARDARRVPRVGRARRAARRRGGSRRRDASRRSCRSLRNDLEPAAEARRAPARRVPRRARGGGRSSGDPRRERLGLRRAGERRGELPQLVEEVGRRLRVPVVGDERQRGACRIGDVSC